MPEFPMNPIVANHILSDLIVSAAKHRNLISVNLTSTGQTLHKLIAAVEKSSKPDLKVLSGWWEMYVCG